MLYFWLSQAVKHRAHVVQQNVTQNSRGGVWASMMEVGQFYVSGFRVPHPENRPQEISISTYNNNKVNKIKMRGDRPADLDT